MNLTARFGRLIAGMTATLAALAALLTLSTLLAASSPAPARKYLADTYIKDFGLAGLVPPKSKKKYVLDWDCGCPSINNRPSIVKWKKGQKAWNKKDKNNKPIPFDPNTFPARCLKENHSTNLENKAFSFSHNGAQKKMWLPYNSVGDPWPVAKYPHGYPPSSAKSPHPGTFPYIPFPGWPRRRAYDPKIKWDDTARSGYRKWYQKNGVRPADQRKLKKQNLPSNPPVPPPTGWTVRQTSSRKQYKIGWKHYQIHHIHERRFGGENNYGNLVPVYSRRGTNVHQQYTSWWTRAKVDSDILKLKTKATKDLRDKLSKCPK